jgi:hypothetical protein
VDWDNKAFASFGSGRESQCKCAGMVALMLSVDRTGLRVLRPLAGSGKRVMDDTGSRLTIVPAHQFAVVEAKFEPDDHALRSEQVDEIDIAVRDYLTSPVFSPQLVPRRIRFMRRPAWAAAPS